MAEAGRRKWIAAQAAVVAAGLVPLALLLADALGDRLGANPIEAITHRTGDWTIRLLLTTLAVTPLRRLTGINQLIRVRRTVGLLAFSYACLHFLTYIVLDQFFEWRAIGEDITKRPYILAGFTSFLLLIPLAVTSTRAAIRRLGGRRWNALHRLVYVAGAGGVLHYLWLVKGDQLTPVYYGTGLIALLGARLLEAKKQGDGGRRARTEEDGEPLLLPTSTALPRPSPSSPV